jgi:hypothetical protein
MIIHLCFRCWRRIHFCGSRKIFLSVFKTTRLLVLWLQFASHRYEHYFAYHEVLLFVQVFTTLFVKVWVRNFRNVIHRTILNFIHFHLKWVMILVFFDGVDYTKRLIIRQNLWSDLPFSFPFCVMCWQRNCFVVAERFRKVTPGYLRQFHADPSLPPLCDFSMTSVVFVT